MTGIENNTIKIGDYICAAFGYASMRKSNVFTKHSATHYRLINTKVLVSYRSLHTTKKARENAKV